MFTSKFTETGKKKRGKIKPGTVIGVVDRITSVINAIFKEEENVLEQTLAH